MSLTEQNHKQRVPLEAGCRGMQVDPNFNPHEIQWTSEKSKRLWDYYSSNAAYDHQYFGAQAGQAVAQFVQQNLALSELNQILDLSCGRGDLIAAFLPLLQNSQQIVGTDLSPQSLDICRHRFSGSDPPVELEQMTGFPAPLDSGRFDLVMATEVIEHLAPDEITAFLAEAKRLLRQGGAILITTPNSENYDASKVLCPDCGCIFHRWQHQRTWTNQQLQSRLEQAGFRTLLSTPIHWPALQMDEGPLLKVWLRKLLQRFRQQPEPTGLVYLGTSA